MVRNHKGLFITIEKTREGLGGTTLCHNLADSLRRAGYDVVLTRESGGTELGQQIRTMLKDPNNKLSKATELFLQLADRAQHYKEVLKPNLRDGKIVISDRYFDSTLMYQGAGRGWKTALLWRLHHSTTGCLLPNLTVVLDGTPFRGLDNNDRFEMDADFQKRAELCLRHLATKDERYVTIDANQEPDAITHQVLGVMSDRKLLELVTRPK